jgi:hypothetical protein
MQKSTARVFGRDAFVLDRTGKPAALPEGHPVGTTLRLRTRVCSGSVRQALPEVVLHEENNSQDRPASHACFLAANYEPAGGDRAKNDSTARHISRASSGMQNARELELAGVGTAVTSTCTVTD